MEYINLLIERGLGNFIDRRTDEELLKDDMYIQMMEQAELIKERLYETGLCETQAKLFEEYIATVFDASERACRISYMTCLKDTVRFLLEMQNE